MFYISVFISLWTNDDKFHLPEWVILEVIYNWGFMNNSSHLNIMILMFHVLYHLPCFEFPCTYTLLLLLSDYLDVEYIISGFFLCIINVLSVRNVFAVIHLSWNMTSVQMYIIYLVYHLSQKVTQSMLREITKAWCVYHVLKVHFYLTTIKKNMNYMMLYPTYGILFLKNFLLSHCRIQYSTHLKSMNLPVYL